MMLPPTIATVSLLAILYTFLVWCGALCAG
ncbi:hypothetical protein [Citrobacter phage Tr1]|nr:hypothetical protein [Citrobacter phage Tr1]